MLLSLILYFAYNIAVIMAADVLYALVIMFAKAYGLFFILPAFTIILAFFFFVPRHWIFVIRSFLWPYVWATILAQAPGFATLSWLLVDIIAGITWSIMILIAAGCEIAHRYQ